MNRINPGDLPEALLRRNLQSPPAIAESELQAIFRSLQAEHLPAAARVAAWARAFLGRGDTVYLLGDDPGGYVAEGRLVDDRHLDCMLFACRIVELAVSSTPDEAVAAALERRFPGARPEEVILPDGRVAYDHPRRLTYACDLIRAGSFGEDITASVGPVERDPGTVRFPANTVGFIAKDRIDHSALNDGDIVHLVLDERHPGAAELRGTIGNVIGHMGIALRSPDVDLAHAASHDLTGEYTGGRLVRVDLATYLRRVERFKGIIVTRLTPERRAPVARD